MNSIGYRYLEHCTDSIIEAYGSSLEELFQNCAKGLVNIMFDISKVEPRKAFTIKAEGDELETLLYDWLEKVLLKILIDQIIPSRYMLEIYTKNDETNEKRYHVNAHVGGETVNYDKHNYKIEIKAVTYHNLKIYFKNNQYTATFLADL
ncbi:MAG TPA: archease [Nitrososphaeraceae archaeon]|nr:archease [Nitrososphaeraceae archaeon]